MRPDMSKWSRPNTMDMGKKDQLQQNDKCRPDTLSVSSAMCLDEARFCKPPSRSPGSRDGKFGPKPESPGKPHEDDFLVPACPKAAPGLARHFDLELVLCITLAEVGPGEICHCWTNSRGDPGTPEGLSSPGLDRLQQKCGCRPDSRSVSYAMRPCVRPCDMLRLCWLYFRLQSRVDHGRAAVLVGC